MSDTNNSGKEVFLTLDNNGKLILGAIVIVSFIGGLYLGKHIIQLVKINK